MKRDLKYGFAVTFCSINFTFMYLTFIQWRKYKYILYICFECKYFKLL